MLTANIYTKDHIISDSKYNSYEHKVLLLKPEIIREAVPSDGQIIYTTGGSGCNPDARGQSIFAINLLDGQKERYQRSDVLGELRPDSIFLQNRSRQLLLDEILKYEEAPEQHLSQSDFHEHISKKAEAIREAEIIEELEEQIMGAVEFSKVTMTGSNGLISFLANGAAKVEDISKIAPEYHQQMSDGLGDAEKVTVHIEMLGIKSMNGQKVELTNEQFLWVNNNFNLLEKMNKVEHGEVAKGQINVLPQPFLFAKIDVESNTITHTTFFVAGDEQLDEYTLPEIKEFERFHKQQMGDSCGMVGYSIRVNSCAFIGEKNQRSTEELLKYVSSSMKQLIEKGEILAKGETGFEFDLEEYEEEYECE